MKINKITDFYTEIRIPYTSLTQTSYFHLASDVHFDNPDCDRKLFFQHLDKIKSLKGKSLIFGDFFCLMQGKYDPRKSKSKVRPEHNKDNYLDAVFDDTANKLKPYRKQLGIISEGNHECYHPDTEVLTDTGWTNIKDLNENQLIAQFDKNSITYAKPLHYVTKQVKNLVLLKGAYSSQLVSKKHAVVLNDMNKVNAIDLPDKFSEEILALKRIYTQEGVKYSNDYLELLTAIIMDGCFWDKRTKLGNSNKARIQIKISKPRKIEYFVNLLNKNNIKYTIKEATKGGLNKLQPYLIRIYGKTARSIIDDLGGKKQFPFWFTKINKIQFEYVLKALLNTDGYQSSSNCIDWSTVNKHDIDIMQIMCVHNGYIMSYQKAPFRSGFKKGKPQYVASIYKKAHNKKKIKKSIVKYEGLVYCLNMPLGNFITRYKGKTAFSGNTSVTSRVEVDPLHNLAIRMKGLITMGYHGFIKFIFHQNGSKVRSCLLYFHHGKWGSITSSVNKHGLTVPQADIIVSGHTHSEFYVPVPRLELARNGEVSITKQHHIKCGTYKDEFVKTHGFGVERIATPKNIGSWLLKLSPTKKGVDIKLETM